MSAKKKWRKISGPNRLPEIIQGVEFKDGIKQLQTAAGVSPSVGLLSRNNKSTRYAANLQTAQTPDSVIALDRWMGYRTLARW